MRVACLHTLESNVAVFDEAAKALGVSITHEVREDLLSDAEAIGGLTQEIIDRAAIVISELADSADAVVLTCSTVGPSVVAARQKCGKPILRVDEALAEQAVGKGGDLVVLYAVQTTLEPTRQLFEAAGADSAKTSFRQVEGAWDAFKAGDIAEYDRLVAAAVDACFEAGATTVALAQASMSGAAALCTAGTPLTSPSASLNVAAKVAVG